MKKITKLPYATNKGGKIEAINGKPKDEPKAQKITGTSDLRSKRGK